jgi:hypothetical protein
MLNKNEIYSPLIMGLDKVTKVKTSFYNTIHDSNLIDTIIENIMCLVNSNIVRSEVCVNG